MRRIALLAAALQLAACSTIAGPPTPRSYRLAYPAPAPEAAAPLGIVRVGPIGTAQIYDRQGFVYRDGAYEIGVDPYNGWIAAPSSMIADLLARDLAAAGAATAVLQAASALPADYELGGQIEELGERGEGGCTAALQLRILLVRVPPSGARQVAFEDVFAAEQPCAPGDPSSFAEAMSLAVQQVSAALRARIAALPADG
jgi:ABC-type uncharacterized transport system auxiliary subunit